MVIGDTVNMVIYYSFLIVSIKISYQKHSWRMKKALKNNNKLSISI